MFPSFRSYPPCLRLAAVAIVAAITLASCEPTATQPTGPAAVFEKAREAFKSSQIDKALELTDKLAASSPPVACTECARVLRAVIYTGELKSAKELAEAYGKGSEKSKNTRFQSAYRRLHNDNLQAAEKAVLNLAQTAHQIAPAGEIPKEITLEANFPTTEGPVEIPQLAKVEDGGWLEPDQQEVVAADSLRKGIDDALADAVGGDRAKARQALAGGSVKLQGVIFALFLTKELADGAVVFDRHHGRDSLKLKTICDEGDLTLKAAEALLKETPDKDQEKEAKKLHDKLKTIRKDA